MLLGKLHAEQPEHLVRVCFTINVIFILADLDYLGALVVVLVLNIAHDRFNDVLKRHDARSASVLVRNDRHAGFKARQRLEHLGAGT